MDNAFRGRRRRSAGRLRSASPYLLSGLLTVTGTLHFVVPRTFAAIVPDQLPSPMGLVYASGAAELACAAGLTVPRTRRVAGWASAALFVAVFPGNVQMALDAGARSSTYRAIVYARLPLQVPLVVWGVSVARWAGRPGHRSAPWSSPGSTSLNPPDRRWSSPSGQR